MTNGNILLVEDNPDDELLTRRALSRSKISNRIEVARDGQEALDCLFGQGQWAGKPIVPIVTMLDIGLPRISGLDVLKALRNNPKTRRYPVVMLTSSNSEEDLIKSYDLGVNSYLRKPVNHADFIEALQAFQVYWLLLNQPPPEISDENRPPTA